MAEQQRRIAESAASRARKGAATGMKPGLAKQEAVTVAPMSPARMRKLAQAVLAEATERTTYEDETGRKWAVLVPVGKPQEAQYGIVLGPPDVRDVLGSDYPESVLFRLHDELFNRGLITERDLFGRGQEIQAAFTAALRNDVQAIMRAYKGGE